MKLKYLEVENYRSIEKQTDGDGIKFNGLDCLVGKNNAGKSNILEAIMYLLGEESLTDEHYYNHDTSLTIDVRGYFEVSDADLSRLNKESKEVLRSYYLNDQTVGVCRKSNNGSLQIISYYPEEERLRKNNFEEFIEDNWSDVSEKEKFEDSMVEHFPEILPFVDEGKTDTKKGWDKAYQTFIREEPEEVEFIQLPASPEKDIKGIITELLPKPVFIPAVKEVEDATKTSSAGELGGLLNELSQEIQEELDEAIKEAMREVERQLNVVQVNGNGETIDERHSGVKAIEGQISEYLSETFRDFSVLLKFPNPESKTIFRNAEIIIKEGERSLFSVESVGEGVKRVLIFSLIRTLSDLKQGNLTLVEGEQEAEERVSKPLLLLYEETELFLHPGLQRILLRALDTLDRSGNQVVFTTHSPFLLQESVLSTINLVSKENESGTVVIGLNTELNKRGDRTKTRLLQIENVSSYIFADKVLLVEGISDYLIIRKIAPKLKREWDFELQGIPILQVRGKGELPIFKNFLNSLGIEVFSMTDIDAVRSTLLKLCSDDSKESIKSVKDQLQTKAQELAETEEFETSINRKYVEKLTDGYQWKRVFENLKAMYLALEEDENCTVEQMACLEKLLLQREEETEKVVLRSTHEDIIPLRTLLVRKLLEENVLLLSGDIEDYYPEGSTSSKVEAAIKFSADDYEKDELTECYTPMNGSTDMELFLAVIFNN